ncbi:MAG: GNAT family N-acetyltransferase [Dehalococcoidales bacterium]|nr:MAG: GNAT family N-acetyltransferase [Dehalococcoidales bacterium]
MNEIVIRQANRNDAPGIHELHTRSVMELCKSYYSDDQIHGWIDHRTPEGYYSPIDQGTYFVALIDSRIVGFGEAIPGEVLALFVSPDHVNQGIGTMLLDHAIKTASRGERISLESTLNAVSFYIKNGFVRVERRTTRRGNVDLPVVLMHYDSTLT